MNQIDLVLASLSYVNLFTQFCTSLGLCWLALLNMLLDLCLYSPSALEST